MGAFEVGVLDPRCPSALAWTLGILRASNELPQLLGPERPEFDLNDYGYQAGLVMDSCLGE